VGNRDRASPAISAISGWRNGSPPGSPNFCPRSAAFWTDFAKIQAMRTLDVRKKALVSLPASSFPRKNCSAGSFPRARGEIANIAIPKTTRIPQFIQCAFNDSPGAS